jgi:putative spermidine/putrescine transport system permease protein
MMRRHPKALVAGILLSVGLPFLPLVLWSLSERWFFPGPWPQQWGLRAWQHLLDAGGSQVASGLAQSSALAAATAAVSLVVGVPAGRALGLYAFRGKALVAMLVVLPLIVPPLSVAMGLHLWFIRLGLAETFTGVTLVHLTVCLPYTVFVMWGVFANYDPDFEAQARSLGASKWAVARGVTLPLVWPGIVVAGLFSFLLSWSQYLSTLIIGGGRILTLPILLFALMGGGDRPVAAVVSLVFVAPAFLVLLASAHHLGRGGLMGVR